MARLCYATETQLAELMRQSGLPEGTPPANAFRMLAQAPAVGASALRLVFVLLTQTDLDPVLRELVILRVAEQCDCRHAWVQHVAISRGVGVGDVQIKALERGETPANLFNEWEPMALALTDEVLSNCRATERTFAVVQDLISPREVVELLLLIGYFRMICGTMTTLDVEVESPFGGKVLELLRDTVAAKTYAMGNER